MQVKIIISLFLTLLPCFAQAKTVRYELTATRQKMNLSGKQEVDFAIALNGKIPAPTLEFTEGDEAEIVVKNQLPDEEELSIHWHGLLLPNEMDGVPYVTTPPIRAGESYTFRFPLRQNGTYWYHSHTGMQEQKGVFGAFVIHPKKEPLKFDKEAVILISDWADEDGDSILRNLKKDGDYYLYKKGTIRSWAGAIGAGKLGTYLYNEWTRMGGMDLSDVGYDAFLINGKREDNFPNAKAGEKWRLRLINAGASTYFSISSALPLEIVAADGLPISPLKAKTILMGMAETYDVLVTIPDDRTYELRASAQDGTGYASAWLGKGARVPAPDLPQPDLYASMDHSAHAGHGAHAGQTEHSAHAQSSGQRDSESSGAHSGHGASTEPSAHSEHAGHTGHANHTGQSVDSGQGESTEHNEHFGHTPPPSKAKPIEHSAHAQHSGHAGKMDHSAHQTHADHSAHTVQNASVAEVETATVDHLSAITPTTLPPGRKIVEAKLVLGGDMARYVWHIDGKAIHQSTMIEVNEGDIIRYTLENGSMMHHPMHLHGHFFRVLNDSGERSPLKHTVDVPPHGSRTIEWLANEPGIWLLHCHNLYHMHSGMGRILKYSSFTPKKEIQHLMHSDPHGHDPWYFAGLAEASSNHGRLLFRGSKTWDQLETRLETSNSEGKNFSFRGQWEFEGDLFYRRFLNNYLSLLGGGTIFEEKGSAVAGVGYLLPMLIESNIMISHRGKLRIDLEKKFQWTSWLFTDVDFTWRPDQGAKHAGEVEVSLMYSTNWHWAAGLMLTNDSLGGGVIAQF